MNLQEVFEIPDAVTKRKYSPAFAQFLSNWFGNTWALTHYQIDLTFLEMLSPEELETARDLIRRNLKLRMPHVIQGTSALHDTDAIPILQAMLRDEADESLRLTIAGQLWKLTRDPVFVACLNQAKQKGGKLFAAIPHLLQVLWLDDERALDFLIDLLDYSYPVGVLGQLNWLEFGRLVPSQPDDYRRRRHDPAFRELMTAAVRRRNREVKNGA